MTLREMYFYLLFLFFYSFLFLSISRLVLNSLVLFSLENVKNISVNFLRTQGDVQAFLVLSNKQAETHSIKTRETLSGVYRHHYFFLSWDTFQFLSKR